MSDSKSRRTKGSASAPWVGSGGSTPRATHDRNTGSSQPSPIGVSAGASTKDETQGQVRRNLKELYNLIQKVQEERSKSEHNLNLISKTHEKMQNEQKVTSYYKNKLKQLYGVATADATSESEVLRKALRKIYEIKELKTQRSLADRPKPVLRRGALMLMLQQSAVTLPLWIGSPGETPPALCGAVSAGADYIAKPNDKVAARVKASDGEENWILAEVVSWVTATNKYEVDDIDAEEGKERHVLSKRRIVPLPLMKANPETDPEALFHKGTLVLALYPQTTCFYKALVHDPPKKPQEEYSVLFEDTSYADGFSPPLTVPQRYVIMFKEGNKKK